MVHDQTNRTGIDRRDGFVNRVEQNAKINVVSMWLGGDQPQSTEHHEVDPPGQSATSKGIFGANEGSVLGVANGQGGSSTATSSSSASPDSGAAKQKAFIGSGLMAGAITQNPVGIGYETVEAALRCRRQGAEALPKVIDTGFFWYDKTNMTAPEIAAVLYD